MGLALARLTETNEGDRGKLPNTWYGQIHGLRITWNGAVSRDALSDYRWKLCASEGVVCTHVTGLLPLQPLKAQAQAQAGPSVTPTLRVMTRLAFLDVTVSDRKGARW